MENSSLTQDILSTKQQARNGGPPPQLQLKEPLLP